MSGAEEVGEVSEAVTGALGANPRKGDSHGWSDVEKELSDVIVTAVVALATISWDRRRRSPSASRAYWPAPNRTDPNPAAA